MRIPRLWLVLVLLALPTAARAHEHKMDLYGGPSLESGSVLVGLLGSVSIPIAIPETDVRHLSVVADVSAHWGTNDRRQSTVMAGLRYSFAATTEQRHLPFAHVMIGAAETSNRISGDWGFGAALGGGVESVIWGDGESGSGVRAQADFIVRPGDNSARVTVGFFKRWPAKHP